jgi:predicted acylesterase/phospholipase RssA
VTSQRLVNGVFQGGGAKGIAYTGALRALHARDIWFGSVAGSSVGAICASMIAAGMGPDEFEAAIPEALATAQASIPARIGLAVLGKTTSVLEGAAMRRWLDTTYTRLIGADGSHPVTFRELHDATGIELYVLSLDLADGLPVVFCRRTTPDVEVAGAVVSSAAIPGVFPAGRAVFDIDGTSSRVHQLIDGSAWDVLPTFVFQDRAFRTWLAGESRLEQTWSGTDQRRWDAEEQRPVMGFVFGDPDAIEHHHAIGVVPLDGDDIDRHFDLGPSYSSSKRLTYLVGAILASDWARLGVALALVIWTALSFVTLPIAVRRFSGWLIWLPDWLYTFVLVAGLSIAVLAIAATICLLAALMMISRLLADTLLPSLDAALGVPMDVPPWFGLGDDSVVIRVPRKGLKMIRFDVSEEVRIAAIAAAEVGVTAQLDGAAGERLDALFAGNRPAPEPYRRAGRPEERPSERTPPKAITLSTLIIATTIVGGFAWWFATAGGRTAIGVVMIGVLAGLIAFALAVQRITAFTGQRASERARYGVGTPDATARSDPRATIGAGVACVLAAIVVSFATMAGHRDTTFAATVVEARSGALDDSEANAYVVRRGDTDFGLTTPQHLQLGELVFVHDDPGTGRTELAGALDDWRFGLAVVLTALGVAAVTSGLRTVRWNRRCARLGTLTTTWKTI